MKIKLITLFCVFSSNILFGQKDSYFDLIWQGRFVADSIALEYYEKAFKVTDNQPDDLYNAACYATRLLKNHDKAFFYLHKAVENGYYDVKHMENDFDLWTLRSKPEWKELVEKTKLNEEKFSQNRVFEKIKEHILCNNSNALWELYEDTEVSFKNISDEFSIDETTGNKKMIFEEFSALIEEIYTFTQENGIKDFEFQFQRIENVLNSYRTTRQSFAVLTPDVSEGIFPFTMRYSVHVEIKKESNLPFRISNIYTKFNYLEKDFNLFEYVKNNFANTEDCTLNVEIFKLNQQGNYSFVGQTSKKDIEIINKLKISKHKKERKPMKVNELYIYDIINNSNKKYVRLISSNTNNEVLIFVEEKSQLFEIDNIKPLKAHIKKNIISLQRL